jgi:hypothetical protein
LLAISNLPFISTDPASEAGPILPGMTDVGHGAMDFNRGLDMAAIDELKYMFRDKLRQPIYHGTNAIK